MFIHIWKLSKYPSLSIAFIGLLTIFFLTTSNHYKESIPNDTLPREIDSWSSVNHFEDDEETESKGTNNFLV